MTVTVEHEGRVTGPYATKIAAFQAAVMPASNAILEGLSVVIRSPPPRPGETTLGLRDADMREH